MTGLVRVGAYARDLGASLERLLENALDWEHLPHVHPGSFSAIEIVDASDEGWEAVAKLADGRPVRLTLALDRPESRWVTRTWVDGSLASEIRSRAEATGARSCRVEVDFLVADLPEDKRETAGAYYRRLYAGLYDEDERLMVARAEAIARGPETLRARRDVRLADGSVHSVPLYCPHQGLPLEAEPDPDGIVTCPWHGYRFDVRTGRSADGKPCRWSQTPR